MSGRDRKTDVLRTVLPTGNDVIVGVDAETPDGEFVRFRLADIFTDQVADISDMEVRRGDGEDYRPLREWLALGGGGATTAAELAFVPAGSIAAANVQAAIQELDSEKVATTDARLSDARAPIAHSHAIADLPVAASGTSSTTQLVRADDSRLSNARVPPDGGKGDITVSASGATWTIDSAAVTYAKMQNVAGLSTPGRASNTSGVLADIVASADGQVLRRSGTTLGFGTVATAGLTDDAVTNAKLANMAVNTFKGRATAGTGDPEDLTVAQAIAVLGYTHSLAPSGYQKLPSGLIIQWGEKASGGAGGAFAQSFPIAFPTQCFSVMIVAKTTATIPIICHVTAFDGLGFQAQRFFWNGGTWGASTDAISFIAVGN